MIGKELTAPLILTEIDSDQWDRQAANFPLIAPGGELVRYEGDVLVSSQSPVHTIEFECQSSVLRPTEVFVYLLASSAATAKLFVNGKLLEEIPLAKGERATIQQITKEITTWSERSVRACLKLRVAYDAPEDTSPREVSGTTIILLGDEQGNWRPLLRQPWVRAYALQAISFFVLAWGVILGAAILVAAHLQFGSQDN